MIFIIGIIILPLTWATAGGLPAINIGLGGINNIRNIFDPGIAFSFGIVTSITLLSASIADQQYWQRTFAIKKGQIGKAFIFGAIVFGIVPIALSTLGFLGANSSLGILLPEGVDVSMIGVQTVATLLPSWALFLFVIMLLAGLSSTLDSGFSAASSLWVTDIVGDTKNKPNRYVLRQARWAMLLISLFGLILAYAANYIPQFGLFQLFWILNAAGATVLVPTILSLYWNKLSSKGVFLGVLISFIIGLPLFIYANILGNSVAIVGASLFIILVSTFFCLAIPRKTPWKP
jgi:Na+/proline symporter